jgi:hypothetical protein
MAEPSQPANPSSPVPPPAAVPEKKVDETRERVILISYPKIVFLYPVFALSIVSAIWMHFLPKPLSAPEPNSQAVFIATLFLGLLAVNLVVLAFDFPRTTWLTLFFFIAAAVLGFVLLVRLSPDILPFVAGILKAFHPMANATFYWSIAIILGVIFVAVFIVVRFDYWEVRPNELLHHHGFLGNLERRSAPSLRLDKEIDDVFEYLLLRSGRLILHPSEEQRSIILDNVPFINKKEELITRMLGALQVELRPGSADR